MKIFYRTIKLIVILHFFLITKIFFSQNIINTLGSGGIFTVKDASNNFFTVTQSTGQVNILKTLRLEMTTGTTGGVLYWGNDRFLHNYGTGNTFLGKFSGNFTLTGRSNTGIGEGVFNALTTGSNNSAMGYSALSRNTSGIENSAYGFSSLVFNTTGSSNSAFGCFSLRNNTTANYNSAFGHSTMLSNITGIENSAFGYSALTTNTGGSWNSAFGMESLLNATVNFNTAIGCRSGTNLTTGSGVICIGYNSQPSSGSAVNQLTLGNSSVTSLRCAVNTITSLSDRRDKKNIKDLEPGISFLMKIKPRQFNWDKREWYENGISDGSKMQDVLTAGFISQELDEAQTSENAAWLDLVLKDNPDKLEAKAGNLLPVIVKAVQEIKAENERLKELHTALMNKNQKYKLILSRLKQSQQKLTGEIELIKEQNHQPTYREPGEIKSGENVK